MKPTLYIHSCILFYLTDPRRKSLKEGVLPSVNLPVKSFQKAPKMGLTKSSSTLTTPILSSALQKEEERKCYKHYKEFCEQTAKLKLSGDTPFNYTYFSLC